MVNLAVLILSIFILNKAFDKNYKEISDKTEHDADSYETFKSEITSLNKKIQLMGQIIDAEMDQIHDWIKMPNVEPPDSFIIMAKHKKEQFDKTMFLQELKVLSASIDSPFLFRFENKYTKIKNLQTDISRSSGDIKTKEEQIRKEKIKNRRSGPGNRIGAEINAITTSIKTLKTANKGDVADFILDLTERLKRINSDVNELIKIE